MTITLCWDNPDHTLILWTYDEGWTWEHFRSGASQLGEMLASVSHSVDIIFDTGCTHPPVKGVLFTEWNSAMKRMPSNVGTMVVCNGIPLAMSVATLYGKLMAARGYTLLIVETVEAARQLLSQPSP